MSLYLSIQCMPSDIKFNTKLCIWLVFIDEVWAKAFLFGRKIYIPRFNTNYRLLHDKMIDLDYRI